MKCSQDYYNFILEIWLWSDAGGSFLNQSNSDLQKCSVRWTDLSRVYPFLSPQKSWVRLQQTYQEVVGIDICSVNGYMQNVIGP